MNFSDDELHDLWEAVSVVLDHGELIGPLTTIRFEHLAARFATEFGPTQAAPLDDPDPDTALTFDEVEAAGLDGTLRDD